ncbi:hypothetical protein [Streptomyces sp. MH60]|uniref:hypothetical protein n=1 Tax=Streptomyces sp. MH60 TaxID=1940758 RepID=UPI000D4D7A17|nr:hypothetical protein [Streptomyces sp. MH60]PPS89434.1 hypothetical protein BZZ08_01580 [Streptomyces sp. MH60]
MWRTAGGAAAGVAAGAATDWYTGFLDKGIFVGGFVAVTVWFWPWGLPARLAQTGGRRG